MRGGARVVVVDCHPGNVSISSRVGRALEGLDPPGKPTAVGQVPGAPRRSAEDEENRQRAVARRVEVDVRLDDVCEDERAVLERSDALQLRAPPGAPVERERTTDGDGRDRCGDSWHRPGERPEDGSDVPVRE